MQFENVSIKSVAYVDAPHVISSASIEDKLAPVIQRLGMRPNIVEEITGIKARRFFGENDLPSDVATQAGEKALELAGIPKDKIGLLVSTSVCKDYIEPSVAAIVHGKMGLPGDCLNFDIGNACLGFLDGMTVAANLIESGQIDYALVVDGENSREVVTHTLDRLSQPDVTPEIFQENFATLTLGSGAAGMVLARRELAPDSPRYTEIHYMAATEHNQLCRGQREGMITDAKGLLIAGLQTAMTMTNKVMNELNWKERRVDEIIIHQVSARNTQLLIEALNLDAEKMFLTFPDFGNIGPAAVPICLAKSLEAGRISKGDRVVVMGMGSGINCCYMELLW